MPLIITFQWLICSAPVQKHTACLPNWIYRTMLSVWPSLAKIRRLQKHWWGYTFWHSPATSSIKQCGVVILLIDVPLWARVHSCNQQCLATRLLAYLALTVTIHHNNKCNNNNIMTCIVIICSVCNEWLRWGCFLNSCMHTIATARAILSPFTALMHDRLLITQIPV